MSKITHTKDKITRQTSLVVPKQKHSKRVRYPELEPSIDYSMPEKHTQTDVDWEACYGDWRTWEKKSKQIKEWEDEQ